MGQLSFSWENMYFWNHKCTFSVSFLSKFINKYEFGGCKWAAPPCLRKFCIWSAKYRHNFRPFFSLNFSGYRIFFGGGEAKGYSNLPHSKYWGDQLPKPPLLPKPMHLTGFNQAHTKDFCLRRVQNFSKVDLFLIFWMWAFLQKFWIFFLPQRVQIWQKRTLSWILSYFFVQKYIKFPIFQICFARKQQFGGLFCRLGNLGSAMHPCTHTPPPGNGHAFNMYWWYCIVHVQQTLNYTNLTAAPKCKKPNLNLCMCAGVGVWVLLISPFCVKHPIFTNIYSEILII